MAQLIKDSGTRESQGYTRHFQNPQEAHEINMTWIPGELIEIRGWPFVGNEISTR